MIFFNFFLKHKKVRPFLDYQERPGAQAIEKSFVQVNSYKKVYDVKGGLGSIPSTYRENEFVGFSGVEVYRSEFEINGKESLTFKVKNLSDEVKVLTIQLKLKKQTLYSIDLNRSDLKTTNKIKFSEFKKSYRGKISDEKFEAGSNKIKSLRFFLKRSSNAPSSSDLLEYSFSLSDLKFV